MSLKNISEDRENLYQFGLTKLVKPSQENIKILVNHLFRLKVNDDYVINSCHEVEDLVEYINSNEYK